MKEGMEEQQSGKKTNTAANKESQNLLQKVIFIVFLVLCLTPYISPPLALLGGILITNTSGHPYIHLNQKITNLLLRGSVIGLGFSMNVSTALTAGKEGFTFTLISLATTLLLGALLGRWLGVNKKTSHLISCGTAICGGSAIAAISPIIKAEEKDISVSLGIVFILNAIALFVFPLVGLWLGLSQKQFGVWSAIAIHDTSSVVGAASKYGPEALQVATVVKLGRALWIIPVAFITALFYRKKSGKIKIPYFIGLFVLAILVNTYLVNNSLISTSIVSAAKTGLNIALFLIGTSLTFQSLKNVGIKPLLQGFALWIFISLLALYGVTQLIS